MQPTLCSKCKKNVAVVFISRQNEKGEMVNEGLCLKCAKELGLPQVDDMMKRMGISDEDLDTLNNEMLQAMSGVENIEDLPGGEDAGEEEEEGKTATFPFLNRLFSGEAAKGGESGGQEESGARSREKERKDPKNGKRKYLENYCISLTQKATPGSPIRQGLFFWRRLRIWMTRSSSSSRPMIWSSLPSRAFCVRFWQ